MISEKGADYFFGKPELSGAGIFLQEVNDLGSQ